MPVVVTCPTCGKRLSASRKLAGRSVNCPHCKGVMTIPAAPPAPPPVQNAALVCNECGGSFPVEEVFDQNGTVICRSCYAKGMARSQAGPQEVAPIVSCSGCGQNFHERDLQNVDGAKLCASCIANPMAAIAAVTSATNAASSSRPRARKKKSPVPTILFYGLTLIVAIAGGAWLVQKHMKELAAAQASANAPQQSPSVAAATLPTIPQTRPSQLTAQEIEYSPRIAELHREAKLDAKDGNFSDAARKYRELFDLASKVPPGERSSAFADDIAAAQADQKSLVAHMQGAMANGGTDSGNPSSSDPSMTSVNDDSWEGQHRLEVLDLLQKAEASAAGDKTASFEKYTNLFKFVGDHQSEIKDASLKQRLATAHKTLEQLSTVVMASAPKQMAVDSGTMTMPRANMNKGDDEEMPIAPHVATAKDAKLTIAFPIDRTHLIAAAGPLASSTTVTLEDGQGTRIKAKITAHDHGLALLEVNPADISGPGLNYFNIAPRFAALTLRCVALPDSDVFAPTPAMIKANDVVPPPAGEGWFVSLKQHPRLAGAPLINSGSEVVGVILCKPNDNRNHLPAVSAQVLRDFLKANQIALPPTNTDSDPLSIYEASPD